MKVYRGFEYRSVLGRNARSIASIRFLAHSIASRFKVNILYNVDVSRSSNFSITYQFLYKIFPLKRLI